MENNNTINTTTNNAKIVQYPLDIIENLLQEMNSTRWNQIDMLRVFGFLNNIRDTLVINAKIIDEGVSTSEMPITPINESDEK